MVTVVKPGKLRLCIDPRYLNITIKREHYYMLNIEEVLTSKSVQQIRCKFWVLAGAAG